MSVENSNESLDLFEEEELKKNKIKALDLFIGCLEKFCEEGEIEKENKTKNLVKSGTKSIFKF